MVCDQSNLGLTHLEHLEHLVLHNQVSGLDLEEMLACRGSNLGPISPHHDLSHRLEMFPLSVPFRLCDLDNHVPVPGLYPDYHRANYHLDLEPDLSPSSLLESCQSHLCSLSYTCYFGDRLVHQSILLALVVHRVEESPGRIRG